jgi:hypothetical protein
MAQDVWPFISGGTNYTMKFDYDGSGNQIYVGWAQTGSASSDSAWRIMQQTFNGSNQLTDVKWPNGSTAFGFVWDNRASAYTYQ